MKTINYDKKVLSLPVRPSIRSNGNKSKIKYINGYNTIGINTGKLLIVSLLRIQESHLILPQKGRPRTLGSGSVSNTI